MEEVLKKFLDGPFFNVISAVVSSLITIFIFLRYDRKKIVERIAELNESHKSLKQDVDTYRKSLDKFNKNEFLFAELVDKIHIFKFIVDNFSEENHNVFYEIKIQLEYIRNSLKKNYGSEDQASSSEDALKVISYTENVLMEYLTDTYQETGLKFNNIIMVYIRIIKELLSKMVVQLDKMDDIHMRKDLVQTRINNLLKLASFLSMKYPEYLDMNDEELETKLMEYFYNMDIDKMFRKYECEDETTIKKNIKGY